MEKNPYLLVLGITQDAGFPQSAHPTVENSMALFHFLSGKDKNKIHFIHFNHTNPLLKPESVEYKFVIKQGFRIAYEGCVYQF